MRKFIFLLTIILLSSCKDSNEDHRSKFPDSELKDISFLNRQFYMPRQFKNASLDSAFQNKLKSADSTEGLFINKLKYEQLLQSKAQFEYFIDESNSFNSITFIVGEYIPLNKDVMDTFANMLQSGNNIETKEKVDRHLVAKKFYNLSYADVIKITFKNKTGSRESYLTQYLITKNRKTYTMIVTNSENEDYDYLIKNFSI